MRANSRFPRRLKTAKILVTAALLLAGMPSAQTQAPTRTAQALGGFALGADISEIPILEAHGAVYKDEGQPHDPLQILKRHGFNWTRFRLFVHPKMVGPESNDLQYDLALAKRVKSNHLSLLLDFFYSDTWADPGKQHTPKDWTGLSHEQLVRKLRAYNRDTIKAFRKHHAMPDMVEIGNEITNGMMWPDGSVSIGSPDDRGWQRLADLLKAGMEGVREGSGRERPPLIMIHIDRGGDKDSSLRFYDRILRAGVNFDVIGLSDYPWWQGSLESLKTNLDALATRFHKPIVVVETSFPSVPQSFAANGHNLSVDESVQQVLHFPATPDGQAEYARAVVSTVRSTPDGLGAGVFYWAAAWIHASGWGAPTWSADWEGRALFDVDGNALPAVKAFGGAAGHLP